MLDDNYYDLTLFNHPGGNDIIKEFKNKDASIAYKSIHLKKTLTKLNPYLVKGEFNVKQKPKFLFNTEFADAIRDLNFKDSNSAPVLWWVRYFIINAMWMYLEYNHWVNPNIINSIILGVTFAGIGLCIGHDGSHYAVSKNKNVNYFMSLYMDVIGFNNKNWFSQHIMQHHLYTNNSKFDPDTKGGEPFFVIDPEERIKDNNHLYVIWMLGFSIVFDIKRLFNMTSKKQIAINLILRFLFFVRIFYSSIINGMIIVFVTGFVLSNLFIISHNYEDVSRNEENMCWYKNQIETSSTYGGPTAGFLTGGLNYQIEHHCFPRMNSMYYPVIHKQLREICKNHKVKYTYFKTVAENINSMFKYLTKKKV